MFFKLNRRIPLKGLKGLRSLKVLIIAFSFVLLLALHYFLRGTSFKVKRTTNVSEDSDHDFVVATIVPERYVVPNRSTLVGKDFKFDYKTLLAVHNILRNQTFKRQPVTLDPNTPLFDVVVAVTGCSSNHYAEFMAHFHDFRKVFPRTSLIFYDLGLSDAEANELQKLPFVAFRKFDFAAYPDHVRNLRNYAWKPLIIQQILSEFDGIMWFDSSVKFQENQTQDIMEQMAWHNSGFMFYAGHTGHSIISATCPGMMEYFPIEKADGVKTMHQGTGVIVINTDEVQKHIMKWLVICMFLEECISPSVLKRYSCRLKFPVKTFGGCHRYDQAIMSILVRNTYGPEGKKYYFEHWDHFIDIDRHRYTFIMSLVSLVETGLNRLTRLFGTIL